MGRDGRAIAGAGVEQRGLAGGPWPDGVKFGFGDRMIRSRCRPSSRSHTCTVWTPGVGTDTAAEPGAVRVAVNQVQVPRVLVESASEATWIAPSRPVWAELPAPSST